MIIVIAVLILLLVIVTDNIAFEVKRLREFLEIRRLEDHDHQS